MLAILHWLGVWFPVVMLPHLLGAVLAWFRPIWWTGNFRQTWEMEVKDMESTCPGWGRRPERIRFLVSFFWYEVFFSRVKNNLRKRFAR